MPKGHAIDVDAVHAMLWERSDRLGRLSLQQRELATELGVTHFAVCRLVDRMVADGRIRKVGSGANNVGRYVIREP